MYNSRAEVNQFKQSGVSAYFYEYHCDNNFLENFEDLLIFYNY